MYLSKDQDFHEFDASELEVMMFFNVWHDCFSNSFVYILNCPPQHDFLSQIEPFIETTTKTTKNPIAKHVVIMSVIVS